MCVKLIYENNENTREEKEKTIHQEIKPARVIPRGGPIVEHIVVDWLTLSGSSYLSLLDIFMWFRW